MPRRVLLMISSMRGGGSEQQTLLLLRHLDRSRFQPSLFLLHRSGPWMSQIPDDVKVHSYDQSKRRGIYFPGRVLRHQIGQLTRLLQQESIDIVYDRTFHMTMIAGPACRVLGIPRVSTIVSPPDQALPLVESRFVQLKRWRLATAYQQSRSVVAVSNAAARSARSYYGLSGENLTVIHNGVDLQATAMLARHTQVSRDQKPTFVSVGRMTPEKGHRDLIDALAHCPSDMGPIRLWLIGDGPLRDQLQSQARESCGQHQIEFLGAIDNPAPYIAAADALILPSRFEGLPNVVLESMSLGTPVIATRAGGTVELERDQPTVLWANPGDPKSLANAIATFVADRESAIARSTAAKQMILEFHDVKQLTRKLEQLLD